MEYSFEKLKVWEESRNLVCSVYSLLQKYPKYELFSLSDQIRRAVISIPSNIVEGNIKKSIKERLHFFEISYGSLMEVYCQLIISKDLGYITENELFDIKPQIEHVSYLLTKLKKSLETN
ncbi:MAG: four helix bundle protein [Bacteroidales bacterium]|jgi:four helix bundle protein|nr:four helix bundle protein [Bacteroidales bacterium]